MQTSKKRAADEFSDFRDTTPPTPPDDVLIGAIQELLDLSTKHPYAVRQVRQALLKSSLREVLVRMERAKLERSLA